MSKQAITDRNKAKQQSLRRAKRRISSLSPAWVLSIALHAFVIGLLLLTVFRPVSSTHGLFLVDSQQEELGEPAMAMFMIESLPEQLDLMTNTPPLPIELNTPEPIELDRVMVDQVHQLPDALPESYAPVYRDTESLLAGLSTESLRDEIPAKGETKSEAKFFGLDADGQRVCFLVDNSTSMAGGRMATALAELTSAIQQLEPEQSFYVIFYSDMAYPLFYPKQTNQMLPATIENKTKACRWLDTIKMCDRTHGREAIDIALRMNPDLIFVLGDGKITDRSDRKLMRTKLPGVTVHALGMSVATADARRFAAMATAHGGTYRDVGITQHGLTWLANSGPIPSLMRSDGVWGLRLPD